MPKKKKELSKGAKIALVVVAILVLFIVFACGVGAGTTGEETKVEEKVEEKIIEIEKIVYRDDPETLSEMYYHIDDACSFAIGYVDLFEITQEVAKTLNYTDIHISWYERQAMALQYLADNCEPI